MRLRGLPRELNCGNVELAPVKNCQYARIFPSCISCEFTSVEYFELECGHVHCESCLVFETLSRNEPRVLCTVCNQVCLATVKEISLTALFTAKFECPCGEEGSLHQLRGHRSSCRQSQRRKPCDLNESHASCSSSTSSSASTSSISVLLPPVASPKSTEVTSRLSALQQMIQRADEKSDSLRNLEFVVKGYIAEELNRLKEDLSNTSRAERLTCEAALARIGDRIDYLNSRIDHTNTLENRIMYLERAAPRTEATQQIMARIENLTLQVEELQNEEDSEISDSSMQQFIRLQSKSAFLWFDVKTLLRDFNRSRESSSTESQSILVAGYPCEVHLQIEYESNMKTLFAYIRNCEDIDFSASWPMRRNMIFRIHDCHGEYLFENKFSTTEPVCREYFKGPGTHFFGTYYGFELCSVEELTSETSYQRNNGMVCLVITANPCGGGSFDD